MSNSEAEFPNRETPKCEHEPLLTSIQQLLFEVQERTSKYPEFNGIIDHDHSFLDNVEEPGSNSDTIEAIHSLLDLLCSPKRANVQRVRDLFQSRIGPSLDCPICFKNYLQLEPTATQCGHVFCKNCITKCIENKTQCPICMKKVTVNNIFRIYL